MSLSGEAETVRTVMAHAGSSSVLYPRQWAAEGGRLQLFGVPIDRVHHAEAAAQVGRWIEVYDRPRLVMTPDTTALMRARRDPSLMRAYREADLVTPDGIGIVWASRVLGIPLPQRVTGIDLLLKLFDEPPHEPLRIYLLGARSEVTQTAASLLARRYPSVLPVGSHHGYFSAEQSEEIIVRINRARPDLLLVGMGTPRQERWLTAARQRLETPVAIGVGGCLDLFADRTRRAPVVWQRAGLEWLWRVTWEPRRLGRALQIPAFMAAVARLKLQQLGQA